MITRTIPRGHFTEVVAELGDGTATLRAFTDPTDERHVGDKVGIRIDSALVYDGEGRLT